MVALIAIGLFLDLAPESKVTMTLAGLLGRATRETSFRRHSSQVANKGVIASYNEQVKYCDLDETGRHAGQTF